MSKAFTRENDAAADEDDDDEKPLPRGFKNYITPEGFAALQAEAQQLKTVERPAMTEKVSWAASNGDRSENGDYLYGKRRLREIDKRLRFLAKRMEAAEVVDPARQTNRGQVFFGATVLYADDDGMEREVTIVGADEVDLARSRISWLSPVARALHKAKPGDLVGLMTPKGRQELEVIAVRYGPQA
jgi:transcription elongation factor GreB